MAEMYENTIQVPRVYHGVYGRMRFPPYKYNEYPKKMTKPDGTETAVFSQSEELAILSSAEAKALPDAPIVKELNSLTQQLDVSHNVIQNQDLEIAELKAKLLALEAAGKIDPIVAPSAKK